LSFATLTGYLRIALLLSYVAVTQGEFEHNHKHGRGIYTWKTGNKYRGNFEYDALCGFGEMIYNAMNHR